MKARCVRRSDADAQLARGKRPHASGPVSNALRRLMATETVLGPAKGASRDQLVIARSQGRRHLYRR